MLKFRGYIGSLLFLSLITFSQSASASLKDQIATVLNCLTALVKPNSKGMTKQTRSEKFNIVQLVEESPEYRHLSNYFPILPVYWTKHTVNIQTSSGEKKKQVYYTTSFSVDWAKISLRLPSSEYLLENDDWGLFITVANNDSFPGPELYGGGGRAYARSLLEPEKKINPELLRKAKIYPEELRSPYFFTKLEVVWEDKAEEGQRVKVATVSITPGKDRRLSQNSDLSDEQKTEAEKKVKLLRSQAHQEFLEYLKSFFTLIKFLHSTLHEVPDLHEAPKKPAAPKWSGSFSWTD